MATNRPCFLDFLGKKSPSSIQVSGNPMGFTEKSPSLIGCPIRLRPADTSPTAAMR